MMRLMVSSSNRAYVIPRSAAPRAPARAADHCSPIPLQKTLKHSSDLVSSESLGPGAHNICLSPPSVSGRYGAYSKCDFAPPTILLGPLPGSNILLLAVVQQ